MPIKKLMALTMLTVLKLCSKCKFHKKNQQGDVTVGIRIKVMVLALCMSFDALSLYRA